jgi:hypothetical protein
MATISIASKKKTGVTITNGITSSAGDQIITSTINSVSFVSEDISKQIVVGKYSFDTTYAFIQHSLEVFVNGMRLSPNADYEENTSFNGFSLIQQNADLSRWLGLNSCILVTYIKSN